jgi:ferredoxin
MRVAVDADLCQGHGVCESEAPSVFALGKDPPVVVVDEHPGAEERAAVEAAVRYCPTTALRIIEEE